MCTYLQLAVCGIEHLAYLPHTSNMLTWYSVTCQTDSMFLNNNINLLLIIVNSCSGQVGVWFWRHQAYKRWQCIAAWNGKYGEAAF